MLEVALELDGLPVTLLDTAGLRETDDPVEREGVARARRRAAEADLRLGVLDATDPRPETVAGAEVVVAAKVDLGGDVPEGAVAVSSVTGEGLEVLTGRLAAAARELAGEGDAPAITRARHREALAEAAGALGRFGEGAGGRGGAGAAGGGAAARG